MTRRRGLLFLLRQSRIIELFFFTVKLCDYRITGNYLRKSRDAGLTFLSSAKDAFVFEQSQAPIVTSFSRAM